MGNAQSAERHHPHDPPADHQPHPHPQHNKLAKPKTNTDESQSSIGSRYARLSPSDRQQIKSLLLSPLENGMQQSPSGEDSKRMEITPAAPQQPSITTRSNSLSCFGSIRNSPSKLKSLPSSNVSLANCNHAVDLHSALKILEDAKRSASPEETAASNQALQSVQPSEPMSANSTEQGRLSRRSSLLNRSTSSLFRRRSQISTPGVGTRDSLTERPKRWSSWRTPQLDPQEETKWSRQDTAGNSPRIHLPTLDLPEDKKSVATPRAQTPGDREYTHLGSLRLGSLRIANGPPSPAASDRFAEQNSNPVQDDDYFMMADTPESLMMKPTKRRGHNRSKSAAASTTPPLYRKLRLSTSSRRAKTLSRVDSPLKTDPLSTPEALEMQVYDDEEPEPLRRLRVMNKSQDTLATIATMARDYRPDVDEPEHDQPQHDAFFCEESSQVPEDTKLGEPLATIYSSAIERVSSRSSSADADADAETTTATTEQRTHVADIRRPPPTKSDSGYASEGSFVTVPRKPLPRTSPLLAGSRSTEPGVPQKATSGEANKSPVDQTSRHPPPLLLVPTNEHAHQDMLPQVKIPENAEGQPLLLHAQRTIDHDSPSPESPCSRVFSYSTPDTEMCKSPVSILSENKTYVSKRLQKRRPSQQELPLVQTCDPVPEGTIPSIPIDVRAHFIRRMSETPGMDCLERTYATKNHIGDTESQPESIEASPIVFPSPPESPEQRGRHHKRSNTEGALSPSSSRGFRRSISLFRSKSRARKEKETAGRVGNVLPSPTLVDLGTISSSLGQSPYDVAMPRRTRTVVSPTHPHQLGSTMLSSKSTVGMDARTAVDYARTRSKDLALARPQMAQRPKSYHDSAIDGSEGFLYRNRSRAPNVPPVPDFQRPSTASGDVPVPAEASAPGPGVPVTSVAIQTQAYPVLETPESRIWARSTGRGRVVSEMVTKFDQFGRTRPSHDERETYTQLQIQRRKSVGEYLHKQQPRRQRSFTAYSSSERPPQHGFGYGDHNAPVRQLHSYTHRRTAHYDEHYGVELFNVPVFAQRA